MKVEITAYGAARIKFLRDSLSMQDPTSMGITEGMKRSILVGRLTEAFEAGWNARDEVVSLTAPDGEVKP